jgi:hypothetical protein
MLNYGNLEKAYEECCKGIDTPTVIITGYKPWVEKLKGMKGKMILFDGWLHWAVEGKTVTVLVPITEVAE